MTTTPGEVNHLDLNYFSIQGSILGVANVRILVLTGQNLVNTISKVGLGVPLPKPLRQRFSHLRPGLR